MDSTARRAVNRRNAQLSTGPRTDAGKAASAQNATKHGLLSRQVVLPDENEKEFDEFRARLIEDLFPIGELEAVLAERIVFASWRLRRVVRLEAMVIRGQINSMLGLSEDESLEDKICTAMIRDSKSGNQLERLRRYEVTLERSLLANVHELERLQRRRGGEHTPAPAVIDVNLNTSDD
jgi:hypothetical protein